jgi:hypothetical protein
LLGASFVTGSVLLAIGCSNSTAPGAAAAGASNNGGAVNSAGAAALGGAPAAGGTVTGSAGAAGQSTAGQGTGAGGQGVAAAGQGAGGQGAGGQSAGTAGCAGALACEDFESYTDKPGGNWKLETNAGTAIAIDGTKHVSGSKSVKFTTTGANAYQRAYIGLAAPIFPIAGNAFYGRMMLYVTKAANDGVHWSMIEADGPIAAQGITNANVRYGGQQTQHLMANYDSSGKKSDCWQHSATKIPEGKWACMQWYFDGKTNTQKFWLDSVAVEDLTVTGTGQGCIAHETNDTWYFPQDFSKAYVGWESYQKDDAREVWIDDFALGTSPIACPAAP